MGDRRQNQD